MEKLFRQPSDFHRLVDQWISKGVSSGAYGSKQVGAGGDRPLLFYSDQNAELRETMSNLGLPEVRFGIDYEGPVLAFGR